MKGNLKNYIVRVCRDQKDNPGLLVGVVEDPEMEEKKSFGTFDELWEILNSNTKKERVSIGRVKRRRL